MEQRSPSIDQSSRRHLRKTQVDQLGDLDTVPMSTPLSVEKKDFGTSVTSDQRRLWRGRVYAQAREGVVQYPELISSLYKATNPTDPYHWHSLKEILPEPTEVEHELRLTVCVI